MAYYQLAKISGLYKGKLQVTSIELNESKITR